eukprot:1005982-Rhodomonas_salina.2
MDHVRHDGVRVSFRGARSRPCLRRCARKTLKRIFTHREKKPLASPLPSPRTSRRSPPPRMGPYSPRMYPARPDRHYPATAQYRSRWSR